MSHRTRHNQGLAAIFGWPLLIGLATLAGLVIGLLDDGWPDGVAWLLVGLGPLIVGARLLRRSS